MGLFSSTQTSKIDKTTTPMVPDWALQPAGDAFGRVSEIGRQDPNQFVSPVNPLQSLAGQQAGGLTGNPAWGEAIGALTGMVKAGPAQASATTLEEGMGRYLDPYLSDVVNTSLADFDADAGRQVAQQGLGLAGRRGGSGADIATSLLGGELARGRGSLAAGLRSQGFQTAAGLSDADAARKTQVSLANAQSANNFGQVSGQLASILGALDANTRANAGAQLDVGGTLRGIDTEQRNAPLDLASWQIDQMGQLGPFAQLATGEHTVGTEKTKSGGGLGSLLGGIGSLAMGAGGLGWSPFGK